MSKRCVVCSEENVEAGHAETKKHLKNASLNQLAKCKKLFADNKDGLVITCTACPTAFNAEPLFSNREQSRLEVSIKPLEGVRFTFTIKNNNLFEMLFCGVAILNNRNLNFTLNNDDVSFGTSIHRIRPMNCFEREISITFESNMVGVYQLPINFFFTKDETDIAPIIVKEMVVFVENEKKPHEKVISPFTLEAVYAKNIEPSTSRSRRLRDDDTYPIPSKDYKIVFARHLKTDGEDLTEGQIALADCIRVAFEIGPTRDNYALYFRLLLWYEETIVSLNLKNYNMSGVSLMCRGAKGRSYALQIPGLAEKRPSLMLGDVVHVRPCGQTDILFEAVITDIEDNFALFGAFSRCFNPPGEKGYYTPEAKFDVRFFMSRVPMERMQTAVNSVMSTDATTKIFPRKTTSPTIKAIADSRYFNPQVARNPEQRAVVEHLVAGSSGSAPYLVLGPPGTGKTITIVEAILQLARDPKNSILVCTDSNMAADHVATKLIQYKEFFPEEDFILRANSEFRVWETMPGCLEPHSNGTKRSNATRVSIKRFLSYRIVITTLIHAAKFGRELKNKKYERTTTHVFIDEAAQASEPAALVPVCGLLAPAGTLVLAGDPQQLGPVCISREAKERGLGVSLMERLKKTPMYSDETPDPNYFVMLKQNFRSHADILSLPSELFYDGKLEALAEPDAISYKDILEENKTSRAIVFHGVLSSEQRMGKSPSFFNNMELEIVQSYVLALVKKHNVAQVDIGVISPYMRQVSMIKAWLRKALLDGIEVGTVEGFQGKEKRVIILSCVRANCNLFAHDAKYRLGFLVDAKRFNVAMTRAKAKLIVIGNPLCLRMDEKWRKYMQKCRDFGTYAGYDCGADDREELLDQAAAKSLIDAINRVTLQNKS